MPMENKLKQYFPMIRTKEEILSDINSSAHLTDIFYSWEEEYQKEFLDFCTGAKGIKILYDSFFKELMNPEEVPERLEEFIGLLLNKEIKIIKILPGDSTRLADECSLLIMDILVRLGDGSYCNIEVQKIGYAFPGQRCACYSSDLLLRQYKSLRSKRKKNFSYREIKEVYTIVLMEQSPAKFHRFPNIYPHIFKQKSNTGLEMNLLQNYIFIPLDIFLESVHDNSIRNRLDAWLTFLSIDSAEMIEKLIKEYPDFKAMYQDIYRICSNVERVMEMYSEELRILDRNTVQYMVDQMQEQIDEQSKQLEEKNKLLEEANNKIQELTAQLRNR